jgi:membrane-bound ClpP family serine protease
VVVNQYVHQESGKRAIFADWQVAKQADAQQWLAKARVAGGEPLDNEMALRYRLIDAIDENSSLSLGRLGIDQVPPELSTPWLDRTVERLLAQPWLPRLLLTIGFFALMIELGSPGISAGGLLAGLCFLGFFWIEGLNGNVEALEVLLFIAGLIALGLELFVLPGFGLFGIAGLLMLLVSVVLASQTFVWPTTSAQLGEVASNLFWVSCMALGGMIGLLFMHKQLERSPLLRWVTLQPNSFDELRELEMREAVVHREHLLGQDGLTTTRLNPSGKAQFGREIVGVVGTGKMIDEGVPVRVVEVRGNLILVEEITEL